MLFRSQGGTLAAFIPLTTIFNDAQTPANQLIYTAKLANGQVLDGSAAAFGLTFNVQFDATGAVTGATFGTAPGTTLPAAFSGPIDVRVTVTDRALVPLSVTDVFRVNVQHVNRAPVTTADSYNGSEDNSIVISTKLAGVLGNDKIGRAHV